MSRGRFGPGAAAGSAEARVLQRTLAPIPFCEVEAFGGPVDRSSSGGSIGRAAPCLICYEEFPRWLAVGACGHADVCWLCSVRLRGLLMDFRCPVCTHEQKEMAIVPPGSGAAEAACALLAAPASLRLPKLGLVCGDAQSAEEVERLFDYRCWLRDCRACFATLEGLERHLRTQHDRFFCRTCLYGRKVFLHEQLLYVEGDLKRHHAEGDGASVLGGRQPPVQAHADCKFCETSFFTKDALLEHMYKKHHLCTLCERAGWRGEFFRDYSCLSLHYEERHKVCTHPACQRGSLRLVAFSDEDELRMHEASEHACVQRTPQRGNKKAGTRLNLAIGTASYRQQQQGSRGQAWRPPPPRGGEDQIRFARPQGTPAALDGAGPDEPSLGGQRQADGDEDEPERYPRRERRPGIEGEAPPLSTAALAEDIRPASAPAPAPRPQARQPIGPPRSAASPPDSAAGASPEGPPDGARASASRGGDARPRQEPCREAPARCWDDSLLGVALRGVESVGLDLHETMGQPAYRERNCRFKVNLEDICGADELARFKDASARFRRSVAAAAGSPDAIEETVRTYAEQVQEVFGRMGASSGVARAGALLQELVVLLPDKTLRLALFGALGGLYDREQDRREGAEAPAEVKADGAFARRKRRGNRFAAAQPAS